MENFSDRKVMSNRTNDILIEKVKRDINEPIQQAHFHPYYEIGYLLAGKRQMTVNHSIYTMERGDIVLVNRGDLHKGSNVTHAGEVIEWIGLYFTEDYLKPFMEVMGVQEACECFSHCIVKIPAKRREYVEELFKKMLYEYEKIDALSPLLVKSYFYELLSLIIRCEQNKAEEVKKLDPDDELIANAAEYIYNNYYMNITLEDIAKKYNMSKSAFSKKFKTLTGCGFKEYLISVRIKEACMRLVETDLSITDIALDCGFSDSNYFGDAFRKVKGVAPNKYRRNKGMV